jgi:hypothetical protein
MQTHQDATTNMDLKQQTVTIKPYADFNGYTRLAQMLN